MDFDVVIIGASLAGSTAATILGRSGLSVALIDKATFPRRKPCGEGMSGAGLKILERQGLWPAPILYHKYRGYTLVSQGSARTIAPRRGGGITVRREDLDHHIQKTASHLASVHTLLGCEVTAIKDGIVHTSTAGRISGKFLFIADGSNSPAAHMLDLPSMCTATPRMGASAIFRGAYLEESEFVHILIEKQYEIYCAPLPEGRLNLSVLAPYGSKVNLRQILLNPQVQAETFSRMRFVGQLEAPPLGRAPLGNIRRMSTSSELFLLGDAAEEFDPIGGMGMTHALRSAELAAAAVLSVTRGESTVTTAAVRYGIGRERAARRLRSFTNLSYRILRTSVQYPTLLNLAASRFGTFITDIMVPKTQQL